MATWTMVSRVTGLIRIVAIGAVLGPTYLGNTFLAVNQFPNLTFQALTGSLLPMMLVPLLVGHIDVDDRESAARIAGGFLGLAMATFAVLTVVLVAAGPLILRLLTAGVASSTVAGAQERAGWVLMATVMPQVVLYGIAGTGEAVMNARGKFALAAAAPAFENVGVIVVMALTGLVYGAGRGVGQAPGGELLLLGLGSTGAVVLHAGAQWWGARRVGVTLIPRLGWRDPEVRARARRMLPSFGYAALNSLRYFGMLIVANRVPGGVVAFQLALNFVFLPVGLGAWPISVAMLPQLSRLYLAGAAQRFRDEVVKGANLTFFLIVPAVAGYVVLARPLARVVAYGEMSTGLGIALIAASLASLAVGMLGEAGSVIGTHAAYARQDVRSPFHSMVVRIVVSGVGMLVALFFVHGTAVLALLGLSVSAGNIAGAVQLGGVLRAQLPPRGEGLWLGLVRAGGASAVMVGPVYACSRYLPQLLTSRLALVVTVVGGLLTYLGLQRTWRSPELGALRAGAGHLLGRP